MKPLRPRFTLAAGLLAAVAFLFGGCIEFVSQTLTFRYDAAADTLLIHQQYHGIFGGQEKTEKLDAKEQGELRAVVADETTYFFANWILELSVANLRRAAAEPIVADAAKTPESLAAERELATLAGLLAENVRVGSGPFFRDASGRLCAVQRVTVGRFSRVLAQVNVVLRASAKAAALDPKQGAAARALLAKLADPASEFFVAGSGQLGLRVPDCTAELAAFRAALSENEAKEFAQSEAAFAAMGGRRETRDGLTVCTLGRAADPQTAVAHGVSEKPYVPNAEAYAQAQFGIATAFDPVADLHAFFGTKPLDAAPVPAPPAKP